MNTATLEIDNAIQQVKRSVKPFTMKEYYVKEYGIVGIHTVDGCAWRY